MARPAKHPDELRTRRHNLRFTEAEMIHVRRQAHDAGLDPTEYLRRRALGYVVPAGTGARRSDPALISEVNRLAREIHALGVNANQLALATHTGRRFRGEWERVAAGIDQSRAEISVLLERLLGDIDEGEPSP